jgi:DNA-binding response OmpR family regulator
VNRSIGFHGIRTFQKSKGKFDIVVIDSDLPDMSGLGVAKKIKEVNRTTPTMLLRGWEKGAEEGELRDEGVDIAVRKPLFMDKTYELIENAVASAEKFNAK